MSNSHQVTGSVQSESLNKAPAIEVMVRGKGPKIYVGSGIKLGGTVKFVSNAGCCIVFLSEYPIPLTTGEGKVYRGIPLYVNGDKTCNVSTSLPEKLPPKSGSEYHYPFLALQGNKVLGLYRLAISENGKVDRVVFQLDKGNLAQPKYEVCYKAPKGAVLRFISEGGRRNFLSAQDISPQKPSTIFVPDTKSNVLAEVKVETEKKNSVVASISYKLVKPEDNWNICSLLSGIHTTEFESGGTEHVDIIVDPEDP